MPRQPAAPLTREDPPPPAQRTEFVLDWDAVIKQINDSPGEWFRLEHGYSTYGSTRSSLARAAARHGFEYRVTTTKPQADGKPGVFIRQPLQEE